MSTKHICTSCLRGLRRQLAESRPQLRYPSSRTLTTTTSRQREVTASEREASSKSGSPPNMTNVRKGTHPTITQKVAHAIRYTAPNLTEPYIAYGATEILVKECARVADYSITKEQRTLADDEETVQVGDGTGWWYEHFGLKPCFNTWAQVTFLHMWMMTVRMRSFPEATAGVWHQQLVDHFFYLAEEKMTVQHNIASRSIRNNYLKDLFAQWRGLTVGYDQGLVEGDAVLAGAIWRNVCGSDEEVNLVRLAEATSYVRSVIQGLESMETADIARGMVVFEDPTGEKDLVSRKSTLWDRTSIEGATETSEAPIAAAQATETVTDPPVSAPKAAPASPKQAPAAPKAASKASKPATPRQATAKYRKAASPTPAKPRR